MGKKNKKKNCARVLTGNIARKIGRVSQGPLRMKISPCVRCEHNCRVLGRGKIVCTSPIVPITEEVRIAIEQLPNGKEQLGELLAMVREPEIIRPKPPGSECLSFKPRGAALQNSKGK